ncbi:MAG: pseudouridine synthase, partial [Pseudomonadota bacterium]
GKPSITDWRILAREGAVTRLEVTPLTGRSHQIRVHLLSLGHVIVGDRFYATGPARAAASRLHLHAQSLSLRHPIGGAETTYRSTVPF